MRDWKKWDGNFTVELALLMPIILGVISGIIYLGFYLYDYHKLTSVMEEGVSKAALYLKHESNMDTGEFDYNGLNQHLLWELYDGDPLKKAIKLKEYLEKRIGNRFFIMEQPVVQADINMNQVTIKVSARVERRIPFAEFVFPSISVVVSSKLHDPTQTLRQGEVIVQTGRKIKGVNDLTEKIEGFLEKK